MMMDEWTQGADAVLNVKRGLEPQQMFAIGAMSGYSVITCSPSPKEDEINPL